MSTPPEHRTSRITRAAALMDRAAALPIGDDHHRRILFGDAWKIALPQLTALAKRALGGDDLLDDAMSYTAQKLWRAVQTGYTQTHGYEAILPSVPKLAASTILTRTRKHRDNPMIRLDDHTWGREGETLLGSLALTTNDTDQALANVEQLELRRRLDRAASRARKLGHPTAATILHHGIDDTLTLTAQRLTLDPKDVTTALAWIETHRIALLVHTTAEFVLYLEHETGGIQLDLFGGDAA